MWSVVIHEVWRFFTKHILLSIFTQRRKPSIKFKQKKKRRQHSEKKRVFHRFREIRSPVINWRQQRTTTPTRTTADNIRDLTELRSAVADEGEVISGEGGSEGRRFFLGLRTE